MVLAPPGARRLDELDPQAPSSPVLFDVEEPPPPSVAPQKLQVPPEYEVYIDCTYFSDPDEQREGSSASASDNDEDLEWHASQELYVLPTRVSALRCRALM